MGSTAASLVGGIAQVQGGRIANYEAKTEAAGIETAAAAREADRKEALARAASSQMAGAGAAGISFEGSPLTVLEEDIQREERATERDRLNTRIQAQAARTRGKMARNMARFSAMSSLLSAGAEDAKTFASGGANKAAEGGG